MKQYKHKKTGKIAEIGALYYHIQGEPSQLPLWMLENSNDWEEITKPEYTILSFIANKNNNLIIKGNIVKNKGDNIHFSGKEMGNNINDVLKIFLSLDYWSIHSVRRESDGEVFTIGDTIDGISHKNVVINRISQEGASAAQDFIGFNWKDEGILLQDAKKVKPKEWEITALRNKNSNQIYTTPCDYMSINLKLILNHKDIPTIRNNEIYSVKRLSDGVEFKIGDKLDGFDLGRAVDLTMIRLDKDKLLIGLRDLGMYNINSIKHAKQPLFTTEDGVDIFEGDKYYAVRLDWSILDTKTELLDADWLINTRYKSFSSKEKAEEYILMNKPVLSINDIQKCLNETDVDLDSEHELNYQLKKLVKQKLKQ